MRLLLSALVVGLAVGLTACGDDDSDASVDTGGTDATTLDAIGDVADGAADSSAPDAVGDANEDAPDSEPDAGRPPAMEFPLGEVTPASPESALPDAPPLYVRSSLVLDDVATFDVFPVEGAGDYRVYPLPSDGDVVRAGDVLHVSGATFRCAGNRFTPWVASDGDPREANHRFAVTTTVRGEVGFHERTDPQIGFVSMVPADGLAPLFALGSPHPRADHAGELLRTSETRVKRYVAGVTERDRFLAAGWRDDGLVGYVPSAASAESRTVYVAADALAPDEPSGDIYYFVDEAERERRDGDEEAFELFTSGGESRAPLGRVHFQQWGDRHDELVVGEERLSQIANLGAIPSLSVSWPNVRDGEVLVIEALAEQCPFQGNALADDGRELLTGEVPLLPSARTVAAMSGDAVHDEVFLNGQGPSENAPRVLARAYVSVRTGETTWTFPFEERFNGAPGWRDREATRTSWRTEVIDYDEGSLHFALIDAAHIGIHDDELWVNIMDVGSDVNGKFRLTPNATTMITNERYVHATMSVDFFSTQRRYPQLFITDSRVGTPIQTLDEDDEQLLASGAGILVQSFGAGPNELEVQVCDRRPWDVNNQCPKVVLDRPEDDADRWPSARPLPQLHFQRARLDVFASTERVYVYVDARPFGCAELPSDFGFQAGEARVTYGTVLYHSGVDLRFTDGSGGLVFPFQNENQQTMSQRRFDNLAFRSTGALPPWPDSMTCRSRFE